MEIRLRQVVFLALIAIAACGGGGGDSAAAPGGGNSPSISGVSGTFSQGQSIAIAGSSFSSKSRAGPMLWDNFDTVSNGGVVAAGGSGAIPLVHQGNLSGYSQWQLDGGGTFAGESILFNNSSPKTNSSFHARATFFSTAFYGLYLLVPYTQFTTGNELYISFYYRMTKTGAAFPRQSKAWIAYDAGSNDKLYWSTAYNNCEADGYRTHITELGPLEHIFSTEGTDINGEWVRFEAYLKQSGPDVADGTWQQTLYRPSLATPAKESFGMTNQKLRTSSADFENWTFGGAYYSMCGASDTGTVDVDDFYMDNTQARVEVCNAPTFSASTRCELQLPTAWSDTSITATFNKGYLASASTAYVYVIDATGNVNSAGFSITLP